MKCVALIGTGGVEMTTHYARLIGDEMRHRFGDARRANLITLTLSTHDLGPDDCVSVSAGNHRTATEMIELLRTLGAEAVVLCSRELQAWFPDNSRLPTLSICPPVSIALQRMGARRIGLIGTRTNDEAKSWQTTLGGTGTVDVLLPVPKDRAHLVAMVDREFANGIVTESARADVVRIVHSLRHAGARAVVVCMPEISAILEDADPVLRVFDTSELHALSAVDWMMDEMTAAPAH